MIKLLQDKIKYSLYLLPFLLIISCTKDDEVKEDILSDSKALISFAVPDSLNKNFPKSFHGKIENQEIHLSLPGLTNLKNLVAVFEYEGKSIQVNSRTQQSGVTPNDFSKETVYSIAAEDGSTIDYKLNLSLMPEIPHLYIHTDNEEKITSKNNYLQADFIVDGKGIYPDFELRTGIRGRGNTTWNYPKKPYKLKLESKEALMGLYPAKKWILLAEYLDGSMLYNSVPYQAGHLLEMPYTNHIIPVEVTINDEYQGLYAFTEHKEVKEGRIDIGKEGWLLELDSHYDEPLKFKSNKYQLPVLIQHPDYDDLSAEEAGEVLAAVKTDFEALEQLIFDKSFPNNNYLDYFDALAYVNYIIVYQLTRNAEINAPKSVYIHKKKDGKYSMGIIWDFDWAFGYHQNRHYEVSTAKGSLFRASNEPGARFFSRIMEDPDIQNIFKLRWNWFRANKYEELKDYIKQYAQQVAQAYDPDHEIWGLRGADGDFEKDLERLLTWLDARAAYIDNLAAGF